MPALQTGNKATLPLLKESSPWMRKIDRMGWVAGFTLSSYGVRVGIRSNDPATLDRLSGHLPAGWRTSNRREVERMYSLFVAGAGPNANGGRYSQLFSDDLRISRSRNLDDVLERLESDLRLYVAELTTHRVFVHAGVVGWKGKAIVIPGRSYSGKSTLTAALVRAGATYYSDEYAVFDAKGRVHPFAKPIELREEGEYRQSRVMVDELGGKSGKKPLPVGIVLMTRYKSGAQWRPRKLSPGKGVLELLFNTVSARRSPARALSTLQHVAREAIVLKGARGDTTTIVASLLRRMDRLAANAQPARKSIKPKSGK